MTSFYLKKELTQIKKAAKTLKDPGTISTWKSPVVPQRSVLDPPIVLEEDGENRETPYKPNKKVFLHNWKTKSRTDEEYESDSLSESLMNSMIFKCSEKARRRRRKSTSQLSFLSKYRERSDTEEDCRGRKWVKESSYSVSSIDGTEKYEDLDLDLDMDCKGCSIPCYWGRRKEGKFQNDVVSYFESDNSEFDLDLHSEERRIFEENTRSLSEKHKPVKFADVVGQSIVIQSLSNAVLKGKISPVYLFQGPRGTGKSSTARIFAAALNCRSNGGSKPCGVCKECTDPNPSYIFEVDGSSEKDIERLRKISKSLSISVTSVFIIDECHRLSSKTWRSFLKVLERPIGKFVFVFITTDIDSVPRAVQSRCHRYIFNKIKDNEIVSRLVKIAEEERIDVDPQALELIALNADGSLRDAETMIDQLSLLGKRITASLVHELLGVVEDEKLLELVELAMGSDTAETVKRARDLLDCGIDPLAMMSQMAALIMDILAGIQSSAIGGRFLSECETGRLKHALKVLSEAEKQLRISSDRATWFTATLLQLSSVTSLEVSQTSSSRRQTSKSTEDDQSSTSRAPSAHRDYSGLILLESSPSPSSLYNSAYRNPTFSKSPISIYSSLDDTKSSDYNRIWERCIDCCHSKTLRQLLRSHGRLISVSKSKGILVASVAFDNEEVRARAERFASSITNSIEVILRQNVEVRIVSVLENREAERSANLKEKKDVPMQRIESIIQEQKLESAWLQAEESRVLAPEKNQTLPQNDAVPGNQVDSLAGNEVPLQFEDEILLEHSVSPSLLYRSNANGDIEQISSTPKVTGSFLCCWNTEKKSKIKLKKSTRRKRNGLVVFSKCRKVKNCWGKNVRKIDK